MMNPGVAIALAAALLSSGFASAVRAEPTVVEARTIARGAKFLGGFQAPVRITLTDADTGEVLARGQTSGTTGDTQRIMARGTASERRMATEDSAVFRATLDLDRPRRVTLSASGPLSQPQAATTVTSTQWILPGKNLTASDGWLLEMPGLIVDATAPTAYQQVKAGASIRLRAGVTMLCGCPISQEGPWRAADTEVEAYVTRDGADPQRIGLAFDPGSSEFVAGISDLRPGLYEVEFRAWAQQSNNAGVARTAFFVR
jgi:hypothetical protein